MAQPVRVLHIVGAIYPGGMENFIMNLYDNIDRERLQFDIAVHARKENDYVDKIERMGGRVYVLPRLTRHPVKSLKALYRIVKDNHYPVVIRHTSNALISPQLLTAKLAGAKTICHSHTETDDKKFVHKVGRLFMKAATTERFACSENAGKWMFGNNNYSIVHNAIDIDKFSYTKDKSEQIRREFQLKDAKVYGNIANLAACKNHLFLIKVFKEIAKLDDSARFFCVGEGDMRAQIEEEIEKLHMQDKVILTGIRTDVEKFMSCLDVLIFPSIYEGLPLTLVEAQAAGLPVLMSDTITSNVIVSKGLVYAKSIEADPAQWAECAMKLADKSRQNRACQRERLAQAGYDIRSLADWYQNYLLKMAEE